MTQPQTIAGDPFPGGTGPPTVLGRDALLWDVAHLLVSESSPERVLEAVADALAELVPYDNLTIYHADVPLRLLRPVLCRDVYAEEIMAAGPLAFGRGITGTAAETAQPTLCNDAHKDPRSVQVPGTPNEPESLVAVPLIARGETKGVLCLSRLGEGVRFTPQEFDLAKRFGELAALALDNAETRARLETEVITDHLTGLNNHRYFQERLGEELRRANRLQSSVSLLLYDIDDFKRINDCYGHLVGDQVLVGMATLAREVCRAEDVLCRIGGEEFAVILPGASSDEAERLGERLRRRIRASSFQEAGRVAVSVGVASAPDHASSPRDLIARADVALLDAKARGKDRVRVFNAEEQERRAVGPRHRGELRSMAHMKMLQSLSAKLNRLNDVREIAELILVELRTLIDYHNCRIHLVDEDGTTLIPIAFRGHLLEYEGETFEALLTQMGEGITGTVARTGKPMLLANASDFGGAVLIAGTPDIDESVLCVPLRHGNRETGTIFLSKLGVGQFDRDDLRLLEVLASHAAVALENARLLQVEREAAEISGALLYLSDVLSRARDTDEVLRESLASIPIMLGCSRASVWMRDPVDGAYRLLRHRGFSADEATFYGALTVSADVAEPLVRSTTEPFTLSGESLSGFPTGYRAADGDRDRSLLVAPLRWEPDGLATIVVESEPDGGFTERQLRLARGIADIASLALANANRYEDLERAYVATIEALANALEANDEYTHDHAQALSEMAVAVGHDIGLHGEDLKRLKLAALFHDIGKIGVPSEILRKPGPLSAAERREIERHSQIGDQILEPVPFLQPVRPLVRANHERWDGNGYPDGLRGEDIPLEARIVFVCDAFHAMTTDRPYRGALPDGEAIRRLKLSSGTQFDPRIVEVFVRLHAEGRIHFDRGGPVKGGGHPNGADAIGRHPNGSPTGPHRNGHRAGERAASGRARTS
ncbi:MAG TPA: diguanylate cyclase [Actinomycetota bacterium]|nr:diguanylate cyclase [Actinomycetota bacterium]